MIILSPNVGPSPTTSACSSSQGMAPGATKLGSADSAIFAAQTMLESRECCQAGLSTREYGVMPRKCVRDLLAVRVEQRGIRAERFPAVDSAIRHADIALRPDGVSHEERRELLRRQLETHGHGRRDDRLGRLGACRVRQGERRGENESTSVRFHLRLLRCRVNTRRNRCARVPRASRGFELRQSLRDKRTPTPQSRGERGL